MVQVVSVSDWYWGVRDWPGERLFFVSYLFCVCVVRVDGERVFKRVDKSEYRELKQSA